MPDLDYNQLALYQGLLNGGSFGGPQIKNTGYNELGDTGPNSLGAGIASLLPGFDPNNPNDTSKGNMLLAALAGGGQALMAGQQGQVSRLPIPKTNTFGLLGAGIMSGISGAAAAQQQNTMTALQAQKIGVENQKNAMEAYKVFQQANSRAEILGQPTMPMPPALAAQLGLGAPKAAAMPNANVDPYGGSNVGTAQLSNGQSVPTFSVPQGSTQAQTDEAALGQAIAKATGGAASGGGGSSDAASNPFLDLVNLQKAKTAVGSAFQNVSQMGYQPTALNAFLQNRLPANHPAANDPAFLLQALTAADAAGLEKSSTAITEQRNKVLDLMKEHEFVNGQWQKTNRAIIDTQRTKAAEALGTGLQNATIGPDGTISNVSNATGAVESAANKAGAVKSAETVGAYKAIPQEGTYMTPNGPVTIDRRFAPIPGYNIQGAGADVNLQGSLENARARGGLYGGAGVSMGGGGSVRAPASVSQVAPNVPPQFSVGMGYGGAPSAAPGGPAPQPAGSVQPVPQAPPGAAPGMDQVLANKTALQRASAPDRIVRYYPPDADGTPNLAAAPIPVNEGKGEKAPDGYFSADDTTVKNALVQDGKTRDEASVLQPQVGRQQATLATLATVINDPAFQSGKISELTAPARAILQSFIPDLKPTVSVQQAFGSVLDRALFQEANKTLNISSVRVGMQDLLGHIQGSLGNNIESNRAAVLFGTEMTNWEQGRINAIQSSNNATKAERDYIKTNPLNTPEFKSAIDNTLHPDAFKVPKFDDVHTFNSWVQKYADYLSPQQLAQVKDINKNFDMSKNTTGKTFSLGQN